MSQRNRPPFRADHVGSLLRPAHLAEARAQAKTGNISWDEAHQAEDAAIRDAVAMQEAVGLQAITDGEFRRDYWHLDFLAGFDGIEMIEQKKERAFSNQEQPPITKATGKVSHGDNIFVDHFAFLRDATGRTPKMTIPGPSLLHLRPGPDAADRSVYPDLDEFWDDVCAGYRAEIAALGDAGCTYLQIDDVSFAYLCDAGMREAFANRGDDPDVTCDLYVRLINEAVRDRPDGMTVTVHMCRGNFKSSWVAEGGYEPVAERVLGGLDVDGFFMEYDTDRAGGFEPLRHTPAGKTVVLGLVTSKTPELESADDLKRRIDEASQFVAGDNLCLSPQCGFSSTHHGNAVTEADQKAKLALVVETADAVWGSA